VAPGSDDRLASHVREIRAYYEVHRHTGQIHHWPGQESTTHAE
jgi:hypothetical protein